MCDSTDEKKTVVVQQEAGLMKIVLAMGAIFITVFVAMLVAVLVLAFNMKNESQPVQLMSTGTSSSSTTPNVNVNIVDNDYSGTDSATGMTVFATTKPPTGSNPCAGKKPDVPNVECVMDAIVNVGPQSGSNVTMGYTGTNDDGSLPITTPYFEAGLCPVNVHWHLGAEHLSVGEYDENGSGPSLVDNDERRRLAGDVRQGFQCTSYDSSDTKFTTPYEWQHCKDMVVGQTYEVHWPHSAAGACGTINQYQTPFYDGVFCRDGVLTDTASQIGVQAQVFIIVNDESYYYPDLMRGMIVDGEMGADIAKYTGSTTGTSRDNDICSQYAPITWQVDRKCHMVSASTFDKMCADMKAQRDDMTDDLHAHGSRELVADHLAADNHQRKLVRGSK
eukprot:CAMPEP_0202474304 /NCGR_PEP_ID=MMETSP1360-20130828/92310_1 /ASSEMBLY_ACC=CAM_ASM_000848 /TAXON_ID=515479 /ORGANISM="Licmophora paradoxa, Strain CCMP2313" /LENGTH=389 /DNA_ID=CAMNT_0049101419 /DNA_START=20 /DNA_END=1189 /DNA_ORIENTATION=+